MPIKIFANYTDEAKIFGEWNRQFPQTTSHRMLLWKMMISTTVNQMNDSEHVVFVTMRFKTSPKSDVSLALPSLFSKAHMCRNRVFHFIYIVWIYMYLFLYRFTILTWVNALSCRRTPQYQHVPLPCWYSPHWRWHMWMCRYVFWSFVSLSMSQWMKSYVHVGLTYL